jgi:1-deoxy-D-xylulose-5-phosphate reductoisomerase
MSAGESAPVALNAANEIAVEQFLQGKLAFDRIPGIIEDVLTRVEAVALRDLAHVLEVDHQARASARALAAASGAALHR